MPKETHHPRPLHRSLGFWAGAFVSLFLGWVWVDSTANITRAHRSNLVREVEVQLGGSELAIELSWASYTDGWVANPAFRPDPGEWEYRRDSLAGEHAGPARWWAAPRFSVSRRGLVRTRHIGVPMWAILSVWVLVWAGALLLFRRWQRRRSAAA